jgi:hypothetical protein
MGEGQRFRSVATASSMELRLLNTDGTDAPLLAAAIERGRLAPGDEVVNR